MQAAVGKQVAGTLLVIKVCTSSERRTPWGPSVTIISGMPRRSTGVVVQGPAPVQQGGFFFQRHLLIKFVISVMAKPFLMNKNYRRSKRVFLSEPCSMSSRLAMDKKFERIARQAD